MIPLAVASDSGMVTAFSAAMPGMVESGKLFLPEAFLTFSICAIIVADLLLPVRRSANLAAAAMISLAVTGLLVMLRVHYGVHGAIFSGLLRVDAFSSFFQILFVLAAGVVVALSYTYKDFRQRRMGDYYAVLLSAVLGMFLMASANDILMFVIAVELVSIPSYILVVYLKEDRAGTEAGLKYILYGAFASGIMIYGLSLLYGFSGATRIDQVSSFVVTNLSSFAVALASFMVFAGFAYKMAAAPFHFWAPDVYQGAPTPITAFLAVASKASGFALFMRFLVAVPDQPILGYDWLNSVAVIAAVTMTIGNLAALWQENVKRLLAWSSVAHAGYMLMGLVGAGSAGPLKEGYSAVAFYLVAYLYMTLGAFVCVVAVYNLLGTESVSGYRGLGRRSPIIAFCLTICLFSLIGLPPTAGFAGKFQLLAAAINNGYMWLALVAGVNTAISVYYYTSIIRAMYLEESAVDETAPGFVLHSPELTGLAVVMTVPVVVLGLFFDQVVSLTQALIPSEGLLG